MRVFRNKIRQPKENAKQNIYNLFTPLLIDSILIKVRIIIYKNNKN